MDISFQRTLVFLFFIFIGVFLKTKFKSKDEINGIKKIILNLALPATIFIALLSIQVRLNLLLLPVLALALNLLLFLVFPRILPVLGVKKGTSEFRTAKLLVPSLAPGLSCFPFLVEFLGKNYLAKAAMADLGNKIFVLLFLYYVAMNWYLKRNGKKPKKGLSNIASTIKVIVYEPVNLFIFGALLLLSFGYNMDSLPFILTETLEKLSFIMTPLVLLFIGLAVKIKKKQFVQIFSLLVFRAALVFFVCGTFIGLTGIRVQNEILSILAFGLSACSFWPYAHISVANSLEASTGGKRRTFHNNYAVNILALSFPLSTLLILGVLNSGAFFMALPNIFLVSLTLGTIGLIPSAIGLVQKISKKQKTLGSKLDSAHTEHA